jgi:hypothetical protein
MGAWCKSNNESVMELLGEEENELEFKLRPADEKDLQEFLMGKHFHAILASLDADLDRVAERQERRQKIAVFKAYRRDMGARELNNWLDNTKDYDEDDYLETKSPPIPIPYSMWQQIDDFSRTTRAADETDPSSPLFSETMGSLLAYVHSMHWKIDYLLAQNKNVKNVGHESEKAALQARYPFLLDCDSHIWLVANETPKMLARTSAVQAFASPRCIFLLCMSIHNISLALLNHISYDFLLRLTIFTKYFLVS